MLALNEYGGNAVAGPIDYLELTREGLRSVMAKSLAHTIEYGLIEDQHFYITFLTQHPGVVVPDWLKAQFPEEITIVLQYEFRDLAVMSDRFSVELSFNGRPTILVVPFASVKTFMDPSVNFRLDIPMPEPEASDGSAQTAEMVALQGFQSKEEVASDNTDTKESEGTDAKETVAEVVSLDAFRKK